MEDDKKNQTPSYFSDMGCWVAVDAFGTIAELLVEGVAVTVEIIGEALS